MFANTISRRRRIFVFTHVPIALLVFALGCQEDDVPAPAAASPAESAVERTPAQTSRNAEALETLRENWDSDVITGAMVDEIKKVLDVGAPDDIEPLLERLELLERSGDVYAADFALWWDKRGRSELGGELFWKRELLHEALEMAMAGRNDADVKAMLRDAAATGDPVARMWQAIANQETPGRHDGAAFGNVLSVIGEVRDLIASGDADAAYFLGLFALEGDMDLVGGSPEEVVGWLEMAAEAGIDHAAKLLSEAYSRGRHGVPRDLAKAAQWAEKGASETAAAPASYSRADEVKANSQNNLKQLGLIMKMFANESRGEVFPPLTSLRGHLAMDASAIYPEFVTDATVFVSPAHPDYANVANVAKSDPQSAIADHSYWYLGYMLPDEAAGLAFVRVFRAAAIAGEVLSADIDAPDLDQGSIYRLREGIERLLITDINDPRAATGFQSTIPIMIERPGFHEGGANVLFLDGHVEFISYPGKFPMTESFIQALESLKDVRQQL